MTIQRNMVKRERITPIPNDDFRIDKYSDLLWKNIVKAKVPEGDVFVNIHYHEYRDKCDDDDDTPHYSGHWVVKSTYMEAETDAEYLERMQRLEKQAKAQEQRDRDLYLQLKAKYGD